MPTLSDISLAKDSSIKQTDKTNKQRKFSLSYDEFLPKLNKKGKSDCNVYENYNYIVISEDVLETVEVLKKRKMSI